MSAFVAYEHLYRIRADEGRRSSGRRSLSSSHPPELHANQHRGYTSLTAYTLSPSLCRDEPTCIIELSLYKLFDPSHFCVEDG